MMRLRRGLYRLGFRPRLGSIWHSPSLHMIYAFKDADFVNTFKSAFETTYEEIIMTDNNIQDSSMHGPYSEEELNKTYSDEDNGTMPEAVQALRDSVVGHKIVKAEKGGTIPKKEGSWRYDLLRGPTNADVTLTLDNGKRVMLVSVSDCCAYGSVDDFIQKLPTLDHIITDVGTTESYTKWHILAGMDDVLELDVSWSPGNAFYYAYGINVEVFELEEEK